MADVEMVIFTRTFDFLAWGAAGDESLPTRLPPHFHAAHARASFNLRERLEEANLRKGQARLERLRQADEALACVRMYLRLAAHLKWLSPGQYYPSAT